MTLAPPSRGVTILPARHHPPQRGLRPWSREDGLARNTAAGLSLEKLDFNYSDSFTMKTGTRRPVSTLTTVQKTNTKAAGGERGRISRPGVLGSPCLALSTAPGIPLVPSTSGGGESVALARKSPPSWSVEFKKK